MQEDFEKGLPERARSARAIGKGFGIAQRIIANCFSFLVPVVAGYYVDAFLRTAPVFLLLGVFAGMGLGGMNLYYFVRFLQKTERSHREAIGNKPDEKTLDSNERFEEEEKEVDPWEKRWKEKWSDERWEKDE